MLLHVVGMREYLLVCCDTGLFPHKVILISLLALNVKQVADDTAPSLKCLLLSLDKLLLSFACFGSADELKR